MTKEHPRPCDQAGKRSRKTSLTLPRYRVIKRFCLWHKLETFKNKTERFFKKCHPRSQAGFPRPHPPTAECCLRLITRGRGGTSCRRGACQAARTAPAVLQRAGGLMGVGLRYTWANRDKIHHQIPANFYLTICLSSLSTDHWHKCLRSGRGYSGWKGPVPRALPRLLQL